MKGNKRSKDAWQTKNTEQFVPKVTSGSDEWVIFQNGCFWLPYCKTSWSKQLNSLEFYGCQVNGEFAWHLLDRTHQLAPSKCARPRTLVGAGGMSLPVSSK